MIVVRILVMCSTTFTIVSALFTLSLVAESLAA